ncbi:hypothetical protein PPERSA_08171 [Pseudocohnilembus persalinus]|uniref:RanBP-type and C3HC4-type zinc finger-containing protein 1 n=1 Tax=Pseudocohnilembus persalinus TaxID=266149 RepID=A0A0V0R427_PSEPJ|nr:hypothetical protein PPERSA_08171 [Pseudocohnilembus persalinus]|eukprot:KRX08968.1 hypothetical protein PPERSA_08171 [Pseudocohnilembus persalinus]
MSDFSEQDVDDYYEFSDMDEEANNLEMNDVYEEEETKRNGTNILELNQNSSIYQYYSDIEFERFLIEKINKLAHDTSLKTGQILYILQKNQFSFNKTLNNAYDYVGEILNNQNSFNDIDKVCNICFSDTDLFSQQCEHYFCKKCYAQYLEQIITDMGKSCIYKTCPMDGCKLILNIETFQKIIACPKNYCDTIIVMAYEDQKLNFQQNQMNVSCQCGQEFCSQCQKEAHRPVNCQKLLQWLDLIQGKNQENLNNAWIAVNTKKCPQCKVDIQKNQGCMHMTCRNCRHEFCWLCLSNWREHRNCNKFENDITDKQNQLKRYEFYTERYNQHMKGLKQFSEQMQELDQQFLQFFLQKQKDNMNKNKIINYQNYLKLIERCRRAIGYSYIIGYHIKDDYKREFFEFQQGNIEQQLENFDKKVTQINYDEQFNGQFGFEMIKFIDYMNSLNILAQDLSNYFNNMLEQFEKEIPECQPQNQENKKYQKDLYQYQLNKQKKEKVLPGRYTQEQQKVKTQKQNFSQQQQATISKKVNKNILINKFSSSNNDDSDLQKALKISKDQLQNKTGINNKNNINDTDWQCQKCTAFNPIEYVVCQICFHEKL